MASAPRLERRLDDMVGTQITVGDGRGADIDGFICHRHMQRVRIRIGIDRNGADTHFLRRTNDAAGDFTTIGNEDFGEHFCHEFRFYSLAFGICPVSGSTG